MNPSNPDGGALVWAARRAHALGIRGIGCMLRVLARRMPSLQMLPVPTVDGRTLYLDLRESMCWPYFFLGRIQYERGETRFLSSVLRAGDVAVDIGANVGWYATLFAELVGPTGKVLAFEPNRAAYRLLQASARVYPQLAALPNAVSSTPGDVTLHVPTTQEGWFASLGALDPALPVRDQPCQAVTLDAVLAGESRAVVIKCDVEGLEPQVLAGAPALLHGPRPPLWLLEINPKERFPGYDPAAIFRILDASPAGYRLYSVDPDSGALGPVGVVGQRHFNAAAVPKWLAQRVDSLGALPPELEETGARVA